MSSAVHRCCLPGCNSWRHETSEDHSWSRIGHSTFICGKHSVTGIPATLEPEQVLLVEQPVLRVLKYKEADPFPENLEIKVEVQEMEIEPDFYPLNAAITDDELDGSMDQSDEIFFNDFIRCLFCLNELEQAEKLIFDFNQENTFKAQIEYVLAKCIEFPNYPCCKKCKNMIEMFYDFKKSCLLALEKPVEVIKSLAEKPSPVVLQVRSPPKPKPESTTTIVPKIIEQAQVKSIPEPEPEPEPEEPAPDPFMDGYKEERSRCKNCGYMFKQEMELTLHKQACLPPSKPLKCRLCPAQHKTNWELQLHMNRHNGVNPFQCRTKDCPKAYPHPKSRILHEQHCRFAMPGVVCPTCGRTFKTTHTLQRHMVKHEGPRFECAVCKWKFSLITTFRGHMTRHFERNETPQEPDPSDRLDHKCETCAQAFATPELLNGHKVYCGKNKKFRKFQLLCPHCPESFNKQETFDQHQNRHKGIRSIPCRKGCSKMFLDIIGRNSHELYRCGTGGTHVCPVCQVALDTPAALKVHMKAHRRAAAGTS